MKLRHISIWFCWLFWFKILFLEAYLCRGLVFHVGYVQEVSRTVYFPTRFALHHPPYLPHKRKHELRTWGVIVQGKSVSASKFNAVFAAKRQYLRIIMIDGLLMIRTIMTMTTMSMMMTNITFCFCLLISKRRGLRLKQNYINTYIYAYFIA